jgi:hypothetical protein
MVNVAEIDVRSEISGMRHLGFSDLGGPGDGMQTIYWKNHLYVGRPSAGKPLLILDVSDPRRPRLVGEVPAYASTWTAKCQIFGDLMLVNYEQKRNLHPDGRIGFAVYDISDPTAPREISYVNTGGRGVHRMWWAGERYAYMSARPEGFGGRMLQIYDMQVPAKPELVGQWWTPGLWKAGGEAAQPRRNNGALTQLHHGVHHNGRLYCGHGSAGLLILDVENPTAPKVVSELEWEAGQGGATHTATPLPGRKLVAVLDEALSYRPAQLFPEDHVEFRKVSLSPTPENAKYVRLVDVTDERNPCVLSKWRPDPDIYMKRPGRSGPHNLHENRPGAYQGEDLLFGTYYNAGLHVLDISDPANPKPRAHFVPQTSYYAGVWTNDLCVAREGRIFITDRVGGGVHILELT